jgi:protein O-mannosyl-transferase
VHNNPEQQDGLNVRAPLESIGSIFPNACIRIVRFIHKLPNWLHLFLGTVFFLTVVFIVYRPVLPGSFVIDDASLTGSDNPLVNGTLTPWTIWFQADFTLATFCWWVQRYLWGENPAGYHAVCLALHAVSGVLLWRCLARLKISGAWLAAILFLVHPVCVNSVARISELKNTLSLPLFLLTFLGYLHYEVLSLYPNRESGISPGPFRNRATLWYGFSMVTFVLALLSKTTVVMLPVVLLACAAWQRGRVTRRDLVHTLPFFILSASFGLMSVWFQKHQALLNARLELMPASVGERLAGAGQDIWFYIGKVLLPVNLTVVYPFCEIEPGSPWSYVPDLLIVAVFLICWQFRRTWGRHVLFGLGGFAICLFPALGFFDAQFLTMWRVSDHLQYLPMVSLVALGAASLASLPNRMISSSLAIALILTLSCLTFKRAQVFATDATLARDTLSKNPAAWTSHNDLGIDLAKQGHIPDAIGEFQSALHYNPNYADAHLNLGISLMLVGKPAEAEAQFLAVLKFKPYEPEAHRQLAAILASQGNDAKALYHLKLALLFKPDIQTRLQLASLLHKTGDSRGAVEQLRRVLQLDPKQIEALNNLAWILATSSDDTLRSGTEAVQCAEEACRLTAHKNAGLLSTLAAAYAEAGRFSDAVDTACRAIQMQEASGQIQPAGINKQLLNLYHNDHAYHESAPVGESR